MGTRTCPYCKQDIPADSLKCHYCREWVNRRHPVRRVLIWVLPLIVLWLGVLFLMPLLMDRMALREDQYWKQPEAIRIVSHHASQNEKGEPCVMGTMKNTSARPWDSITIQVDYFDSSGKLVDTGTQWSGDTLAPGEERSFKVAFGARQRNATYHHYRVFVAGAEDATRF